MGANSERGIRDGMYRGFYVRVWWNARLGWCYRATLYDEVIDRSGFKEREGAERAAIAAIDADWLNSDRRREGIYA